MRISKKHLSLGIGITLLFSFFIIGLQFNHLFIADVSESQKESENESPNQSYENSAKIYIDTNKYTKKYESFVERQEEYIKYVFRRSKGDFLLLTTDNKDFTKDLINFFKKRAYRPEL